MRVHIKEVSKPQCWYEEEEGGYRVCVRTLKGDYFRTDYTKCVSKDAAIDLVQLIRNNGHISIPRDEIKLSTSNCTEQENGSNVEEYSSVDIKPVIEEEKPKAKFEFNCDDELERQYNKIPRYGEASEERNHKTGVNKLIKYGNVLKGKGIL